MSIPRAFSQRSPRERTEHRRRAALCDGWQQGIRKAVEQIFEGYALIQRCRWHKRGNVVDYLPKGRKTAFRKLLQKAYEQPTYEGAKGALIRAKKDSPS